MKKIKLATIDVGGTNIKYALFDGELDQVREVPTPYDGLDSFLSEIKSILNELGNVDGIALSFPGFVDNLTGMKYKGGTLEYLDNTNIKELLEKTFDLPASIENDAKCAALAEQEFGNLKGEKNAAVLIFGTGVGGAIIVDGKILKGKHLLSGELSFLNGNYKELPDWNNIAGNFCGRVNLSKLVEEYAGLKDLNGKEIFKEVNEGNEKVLEALEVFCQNISWIIYNLQFITDPELILIGGGISVQPKLISTIKEKVVEVYSELKLELPEIKACKHLSSANLLGAAINFYRTHEDI